VRDQALVEALAQLQGGGRAPRVAVISPSAGTGRGLLLASTTVIVDDAFLMTGTTHLWRRGLSFDSSVAVALFDERLDEGRPAELRAARRALIAGRLGLPEAEVPDDPDALVSAARALVERGGLGRLGTAGLRLPADPADTAHGGFTELDLWDPDGTPPPGLNPVAFLAGLTDAAVSESFRG
jgi:hypothetical protein